MLGQRWSKILQYQPAEERLPFPFLKTVGLFAFGSYLPPAVALFVFRYVNALWVAMILGAWFAFIGGGGVLLATKFRHDYVPLRQNGRNWFVCLLAGILFPLASTAAQVGLIFLSRSAASLASGIVLELIISVCLGVWLSPRRRDTP